MTRWTALVMFGVLALLGLPTFAQEGPGWNGPPCRNGYYKACSQEPPIPLDRQPCYVSHITNYVPRAPERAMVALCQAAKAALADPPHRTLQELAVVNSAAIDLAAAVDDDPGDASNLPGFMDEFHAVALDMVKLGARVMAHGPRGFADGSDPVSETLQDIIGASSVLAGL